MMELQLHKRQHGQPSKGLDCTHEVRKNETKICSVNIKLKSEEFLFDLSFCRLEKKIATEYLFSL